MNYQITLNLPSGNTASFLQKGFFPHYLPTAVLHKHNYSEVHVVCGGDAAFSVENKKYNIKSGSAFVIPRGAFHFCLECDEKCLHSAFQLDLDVDGVKVVSLGTQLLESYFKELDSLLCSDNFNKVITYLNFFCGFFDEKSNNAAQPISDYGFIIYEFFANNYARDVKLCDLSQQLHLSSRQVERLVMEHTGKSFREQLTYTRIAMAKELLNTTSMPLGEISRYVGYHSYAGFWKAMKKYS